MGEQDRLHMIGHGHIDPVWLWVWQEGYHEVHATFQSALERMREFDDFTFTSSSAAFYAWAEEIDPTMFAEIKQRVNEGRWHFTGGWWIEPDCNIPCGESFVRQGLYGQRFFQEKFGGKASVGFNPDSFGHHAMLPQILNKQGMGRYVFMRPGPHEKDLPGPLFWWQAVDGSKVLCFRIIRSYNDWGGDIMPQIDAAREHLQAPLRDLMCFYGVGNHGGGPTIANIEQIHRYQQDESLPQLAFSSPQEFFEALDFDLSSLPVVRGDLQHHASGCYAAHSGVKRWNRQAENALMVAEKWAAMANAVLGTPYPREEFTHAWKLVLFNQFHDIMAGSSLKEAYDDADHSYSEAINIAQRALNRALQAFTWQIGLAHEDATPLVVFNPHTWRSCLPAEVEVHNHGGEVTLLDAQGNEVPVQRVQPHPTLDWTMRLRFLADLPPLGYQVYRVHQEEGTRQSLPHPALETTFENEWLRLRFDVKTGLIASLYDKRSQREVFSAPAAMAAVIDDPSDTWSHGVFKFDQQTGAFHLRSMHMLTEGAVQSTLRVESEYGSSRLIQDYTLYQGMPRIDVAVQVNWQEQFKLLKLLFPVNVAQPTATYEVPYGHIVRPCDGLEEAGQRWVDVSGEGLGVSFLNDGKYSFSVDGNVFGLTVLRSPIYAHHDPTVPDGDAVYDFIDQGEQSFHYSILPHGGDWREAGTLRAAAEINQAAMVLKTTGHEGPLPTATAWLGDLPPAVVLSVIKQAEEGDGLILRLVETHGEALTFTLSLPVWHVTVAVTMAPYEIKTLHVTRDGTVREVNLLEE